jgi:hypothetical protein
METVLGTLTASRETNRPHETGQKISRVKGANSSALKPFVGLKGVKEELMRGCIASRRHL